MPGFSFRKFIERSFTPEEARELRDDYKAKIASTDFVRDSLPNLEQEIKDAALLMASREKYKILEGISIDEINRGKKGFRIKVLKDHGYQTVADISGASVHNIASMNGISQDAAREIRKEIDAISDRASQGVKIRLSIDDKNKDATNLILAIAKYRRAKSPSEQLSKLLERKTEIRQYISDINIGTVGTIQWALLSKNSKGRAETAYHYLLDLKQDGYLDRLDEYILEIKEALDFSAPEAWNVFEKLPIGFTNVLENIVPGILGSGDDLYGLPEELAREVQEEAFFPNGLLCELRSYQEWGVKYILHQGRVLLGDEMGLGKTVQAIATMVSLRNTGATHFCVVCPASVLSNWCREIRKHSLLSVTKVHGSDRNLAFASWVKTGGVMVTTFETTDFLRFDDGFVYSLMIVDEAHYVKNPEARRSMNVKRIGLNAERMLFMTGTALENNVSEMVSLIDILNPSVANSVRGMESLASAPQFREKIAPVYYRRKREDVLKELPELIEKEEWCSLGSMEEDIYEKAVLGKKYTDARRVSWNVDDLSNSSKAKRMMEIIEDAAAEDRKIIVFSFFLDTIEKIKNLLGNQCTEPINGSVSVERRQEIIDEFDKAAAGTVLAAQIQSGGTGLNIQSASVVIFCEPQFKPSIENQAVSRAYRMGQTRNVLVYRLLAENTVDEKIMQMLQEKQELFDAFADKSVAAGETQELDNKKFGQIIEEEIERINAKNGIKTEDIVGASHMEKTDTTQALEEKHNEDEILRGTERVKPKEKVSHNSKEDYRNALKAYLKGQS